MKEYVEMRNGGYYVKGKRISLGSLVAAFHDGLSPEFIQDEFPLLTLEEVYGALTYYLGHREKVDQQIRESLERTNRTIPSVAEWNPELYARLMRAKQEMESQRR